MISSSFDNSLDNLTKEDEEKHPNQSDHLTNFSPGNVKMQIFFFFIRIMLSPPQMKTDFVLESKRVNGTLNAVSRKKRIGFFKLEKFL